MSVQKYISLLLSMMLMVFGTGLSLAQGAPDAINAAYADLSARLGTQVSSQNANWRWEQASFNDTSLGCPAPDQSYAQVQTVAYIFTIVYAGTTYDYRVSVDQSIVVLCGQSQADGELPVPGADGPYSNSLCPPPAEGQPAFMRSRVNLDVQARGTLPVNRLRSEPSVNGALVTEMPSNTLFTIVGGPNCDAEEGIVWWQVDYDGTRGWTAESQAGEYYLEPLPGLALTGPRLPIDAFSAPSLQEVSRLQGNFLTPLRWSPDGTLLAVAGAAGSEGLWLYQVDFVSNGAIIVEQDAPVISLDMHPNGQQALVGDAEGGVYLWDLRPDASLIERLYLKTHERDVRAVAMHPNGQFFASAGINAATTASIDKTNGLLLWDIENVSQSAAYDGHSSQVLALAFAPDGLSLAAIDSDALIIHGRVTPIVVEGLQARALAYSRNGQFIAVGGRDGLVRLFDASTGAEISTLAGHLSAVNGLAFSPDSSLVVSVSEDGTMRLWSTQTDQMIAVLEVSANGPQSVAFNPDATLIAVGVPDRTVRLFGIRPA